MNYYPYFNTIPYAMASTKPGLFKGLLGGINWGSIINGTQRTLGLVNQAIPLIKQARPVINNAKTMFKVMNEFKKVDTSSVNNNVNKQSTSSTSQTVGNTSTTNYNSDGNGLTFFQ